jgi:hypothetical protein
MKLDGPWHGTGCFVSTALLYICSWNVLLQNQNIHHSSRNMSIIRICSIVTPATSLLPLPSAFPFPLSLYHTSFPLLPVCRSTLLRSAWRARTRSLSAVGLACLDTKFYFVKVWLGIFLGRTTPGELVRF